MESTLRRTDTAVAHRLFENADRFEFFQAVRLIERYYSERGAVGGRADPDAEVVRFRAHASLDFAPSQIHALERAAEDGRAPEMLVTFMGMAGTHGVLPRHYTELLLERLRADDTALRDFLDIFNHRLISLFYRSWEKHRCSVLVERSLRASISGGGEKDGGEEKLDDFSSAVLDLIGMSSPRLRSQLDMERSDLLFYSGLLAQRPRSATALRGLLGGYFEVPTRVVQFTGMWLPLSQSDRTRLGAPDGNCVLGQTAIVGDRVWDQQGKFRLRFGPLEHGQFCSLLPSGKAFPKVVAATRLFAGQERDFDVQLVLRGADVPYCKLGEEGDAGPRLGWSAWLKTRDFEEDSEAVVLRGSETLVGTFPSNGGGATPSPGSLD